MLQRSHLLDNFQFFDKSYLISIDGTGYFSSSSIKCNQCCIKEHKNGSKTYYHQMLSASLVHYDQKVVYPLAPEAILKQDGTKKNDCELNASKRWLKDFRREHPHLKVTIIADGLSSNQPFIELLEKYKMNYILVCKEDNHQYLANWVNDADIESSPCFEYDDKEVVENYQYMNDVPLHGGDSSIRVNVLRYSEKNKRTSKVRKWMWVSNFVINKKNMKQIMKGGRARWRIENETFNTLKNHGYNFEHNYGHGYKHLSVTLAHLMLLSFLIDQLLQSVNKLFCIAYDHLGSKRSLWEEMRSYIKIFIFFSFDKLYDSMKHPPPSIVVL